MARVSVIVPLYNVEDYVERCIKSLCEQSHRDFEVVCVDDGSTDQSALRARRAAASDGRFVFVERPNGGLSAARNTGLDVATGEFVCFLDSDDWYEPETLETLLAVADEHALDVVDFSARTVYDSARARALHEEDYSFRTSIAGIYEGPELFARYWQMREYVSSACFHMVRRSLLEESGLRFSEGILHEDELFSPLVYAQAHRSAFLNKPLYCRRMREGSIMTRRPTMRNVLSLQFVAGQLHAWLAEHAAEYGGGFIDALAQDIAYIRDAAFVALQNVDRRELYEYLDKLDEQERLAFDLEVRFASDQADERLRGVLESRTYKAGKAFVAVPRMLRDKLALVKNR